MSTLVYLVRHGETDWNKENRFQGRTDIPLSEKGIWQAEKAGQHLKDQFDIVYASPLTRTMETAKLISGDSGLKPIAYDDFIEIDFGKWEGLRFDEVKEKYSNEYKLWKTDDKTGPLVGGEQSIKNASIRGKKALTDIVNDNPDKRILIVAHGGIIKASLVGLYNLNVNMYQALALYNTSISSLEFFEKGQPMIRYINDICHLN